MKAKFLLFTVVLLSFFVASTKVRAQANANNPYDEVGAIHNNVLGAFLNAYSKERVAEEQMTEKDLQKYICYTAPIQKCDFAEQVWGGDIVQATKKMTLVQTAAYLQAKGLVSNHFANYINKLDRVISQYFGQSSDKLHAAFVAIERDIASNPNLKEHEQQQLLIACAVGRYSARFWSDLATGVTHYAGVTAQDPVPSVAGGIVKEDLKGAVAGAVGGAVAGAAAGGVGAGPGALVGGTAGGLSASAAEAIGKLWDWVFG